MYTGKTVDLEVDGADTTEGLKAKVQDQWGIPHQQQRLHFTDQLLEHGRTVAENNIQDGDTLDLKLNLT
eukprot:gene2404-7290_t